MRIPIRIDAPRVEVQETTPENLVIIGGPWIMGDSSGSGAHEIELILSAGRAVELGKKLLRASAKDSEGPAWAVIHCFATKDEAVRFSRMVKKEIGGDGAPVYKTDDLAI